MLGCTARLRQPSTSSFSSGRSTGRPAGICLRSGNGSGPSLSLADGARRGPDPPRRYNQQRPSPAQTDVRAELIPEVRAEEITGPSMDSVIVEGLGKRYFLPSKRPTTEPRPTLNLGLA